MASKSFKASRLSMSSAADESNSQQNPSMAPTVTFGRRTSSGRYVSYSRDDLDSELGSDRFSNYTVHIPPTPDNQPMDSIQQKVEEQYVSSSLFTGGFNSVTRAHLMDKVIESESNHPQMAGSKGSSCGVPGCDAKVMSDERGVDILPCECDFKICRDCYLDAVKSGDSKCPGCKEQYKVTDLNEVVDNGRPLPLPPPRTMSKMERRLSLMKSTKSQLVRSQTGDFDHNRWLFETSGTYGYGNAIWPKEGGGFVNGKGDEVAEPSDLVSKPWRPLTRKLKIPAGILSPYRYILQLLYFLNITKVVIQYMIRLCSPGLHRVNNS